MFHGEFLRSRLARERYASPAGGTIRLKGRVGPEYAHLRLAGRALRRCSACVPVCALQGERCAAHKEHVFGQCLLREERKNALRCSWQRICQELSQRHRPKRFRAPHFFGLAEFGERACQSRLLAAMIISITWSAVGAPVERPVMLHFRLPACAW